VCQWAKSQQSSPVALICLYLLVRLQTKYEDEAHYTFSRYKGNLSNTSKSFIILSLALTLDLIPSMKDEVKGIHFNYGSGELFRQRNLWYLQVSGERIIPRKEILHGNPQERGLDLTFGLITGGNTSLNSYSPKA